MHRLLCVSLTSGLLLTGAGVLTTRGGGSIATLNGCALAQTCVAGGSSTGAQTGLQATGNVSSLGALESTSPMPCRFVLGSPVPNVGGLIDVHVATDLDVPGVFVFAGLGALPVSPSLAIDPFFPNSPCFPEFYPAVLATPGFFVATPPVLGGGRSGAFVVAAPPNMPAAGIIFQAVAILPGPGNVAVSSPITLH